MSLGNFQGAEFILFKAIKQIFENNRVSSKFAIDLEELSEIFTENNVNLNLD